ncbi:hypothetical protein KAU19_06540 [Candidatus Parcubacteria bacterium]|nr:hypothetical protein [Candidatus Parcubacteria bacterium]
MTKKLAMAMIIVSIGCFILLNGCAPLLQAGGGLIGESIGRGMDKRQNTGNTAQQKYFYSKKDLQIDMRNETGKNAPDNIIEIASEAQVWEYNNYPKKGKVRAFAFVGNKLQHIGQRDVHEYDGYNSRARYINLFPCYSHLRIDAVTEHIPPAPATPAPDIPISGFAPSPAPTSYSY